MGKFISAIFFLCFFALGLFVYQDYGVSFDEPAQRLIGITNLNHVAHHFNHQTIINNDSLTQFPKKLDQITDRDYGVIFELPAAFMEHALDLKQERDIYFARHLLTFLFFFAGVISIYRMAQRRFNDWRIGLLAATFIILSPRIFADAFYNDKDLVFLSVFAIAMNTAIGFLIKPNWKTAMIHGLACAIAIDARIMAVIIPALTAGVMVIQTIKKQIPPQRMIAYMSLFLGACTVFTIVFWPFLWDAPLDNFLQAFRNMAKFRHNPYLIFMGETVRAAQLPWYYLPTWIGITTPIIYLMLFIFGFVSIMISIFKNNYRIWSNNNELQDLIFLAFFAGPILAVILLHSVLYNGWRHLYFVYPAFILISIGGLVYLWKLSNRTFFRAILVMLVTIGCIHTGYWMIRYHPLQNIYFNRFAGDWNRKFEVDYWGLAYKQALEKIVITSPNEPLRIWPGKSDGWPGGWQLTYTNALKILHLDKRKKIEEGRSPAESDFIIASAAADQGRNTKSFEVIFDLKKIDEVLIDDEAVLTIFKRDKKAELPSIEKHQRVNFSIYSPGINYLSRGWNTPETWGVWSSEKSAQLLFPALRDDVKNLIIHYRALIGPNTRSQRFTILINKIPQKIIHVNTMDGNEETIPIPILFRNKPFLLEFQLPDANSPAIAGINPEDHRILGIGLESVEFK